MDISGRSGYSQALLNSELPPATLVKRGSYYDPYDCSIQIRQKQATSMSMYPDLVQQQKGLSVGQAALSFISTIIGAGIVSLPYALYQAGYFYGIIIHCSVILMLLIAAYLYLKTKDNLGYESFGELAYLCLGRKSVFILNFILAFGTSLIAVMYILLFSKICVTFFEQSPDDTSQQTILQFILSSKLFYCALLFFILLKLVLKKEVKELKVTSIMLFTGVITIVLIFSYKVFITGQISKIDNTLKPQISYQNGSLIDSFSIILTSYGFTINFFPIISAMDKRTNANGMRATMLALAFCFVVYLFFSYLGITAYGQNINPDIFENIKREENFGSYLIRILFLCIFLCNIPFIFLPGKEALLTIVDEIQNRTMSTQLSKRIEQVAQTGMFIKSNQISMIEKPATDKAPPTGNLKETATSFRMNISKQNIRWSNQNTLLQTLKEEEQDLNSHLISQRVPAHTYNIFAISLFTLQILSAMMINDITIIFGFFAAITESMLNFILPALFYIISCNLNQQKHNPLLLAICIVYLILGCSLFLFANYNNIIKMIS